MQWIVQNWLEVVGNALSFLCIYLIYKNRVSNWIFGMLNCACYIGAFLPARLYADCGVQAVYIALSAYGWWNWLKGGEGRIELPVTRLEEPTWPVALALAQAAVSFPLMGLLRVFTDSDVVFWDGQLAALCLIATYLTARRKVESWWLWIASNVGYFFLYAHKGLHVTQWCQIGFLALSVVGLVRWTRLAKGAAPRLRPDEAWA